MFSVYANVTKAAILDYPTDRRINSSYPEGGHSPMPTTSRRLPPKSCKQQHGLKAASARQQLDDNTVATYGLVKDAVDIHWAGLAYWAAMSPRRSGSLLQACDHRFRDWATDSEQARKREGEVLEGHEIEFPSDSSRPHASNVSGERARHMKGGEEERAWRAKTMSTPSTPPSIRGSPLHWMVLPKPGLRFGGATNSSNGKQEQRSRPPSISPPVPFLAAIQVTQGSSSDSTSSSHPHPPPPSSFIPFNPADFHMSDYGSTNGDASLSPNGTSRMNGSSPSLQQQSALDAGLSPIIRKKLMGFVGFANLPNQVHRKSVRKGFQFTAMVVGESGLGKSTLINTLFNTTLYPPKVPLPPSAERPSTVAIESISADIEENGVRLRLTVVDTPGFGDFVNNDECWKPIVENIEARFDSYLEQENRVNRQKIVDNRVHACLYFIQPTGHSLKPIDIEFMRQLHTRVNLIPIIAKADTLTDEEVAEFKARILADIQYHNIHIFEAPTYENEDEEALAEAKEIMTKIPFAVVGSDKLVKTPDGREVRGRAYPWGVVEVDNEDHCDFVKLRQMLVRTYMEELREYTNDVLYENWRTEKLLSMGVVQDSTVFKEVNPAIRIQEERIMHEAKLAKMEAEMKMVFQQKVQEKEAKLKQSEEELYARHREMKEALEKQRLDLEDKKRRIESGRPLTPEKASTGRKKFLRGG
ncbi:hypothetical protein ONZ51_g5051 [Trametes cubensis]|uniref:Septin-type G domain-containing protein n=1 Tax=Trametes cubensis TaxID=1111947 RepID=A0AAD7TUU2_9APHY|nr:hypothetical protein ONZ51_g5051 [Trametes cubensis]